ncbi:hypothetical protein [Delftia sp. DT-2]|uniref:hypothetical protein n=1 Tax=Delftia sp. DT-2 TaxID=3022772 RepID=UPI00233EE08C|nr:hypothetical protein [Delftia sp. DT-2]MDC2858620.1 hypothetical protein [Delftia sp. DT-2]
MEIRVKFDAALWFISALCALIVIAALLMAFPGLSGWLPSNSSELASWFQSIGAIGAIIGVWWQTNYQLREAKKSTAAIKKDNEIAVLERAIFIISSLKEMVAAKRLYITAIATKSTKQSAITSILGILDLSTKQLMDYPYWDLPDTRVAIDLQKVLQASSLLKLEFEDPSLDTLNRLDELLAVCHHALIVCKVRLSLRQAKS